MTSTRNTMYENDKLRNTIDELEAERKVYYSINKTQEAYIRKQDKKIKDLELLLNSRISKYIDNIKEVERSKYFKST